MKTAAVVLVVAGCVLCSSLSAQQKTPPQEVFKILGISVEGNTFADPAARPIVEVREVGQDAWVEIPAGVAHGFLALEPLTLVYLVTNEYDGTDELGFAWDDPDAAVPWPPAPGTADGRPMVSARDATNPSLRELAARVRAG